MPKGVPNKKYTGEFKQKDAAGFLQRHLNRQAVMELLGRFELPTSSLPMTCSAY